MLRNINFKYNRPSTVILSTGYIHIENKTYNNLQAIVTLVIFLQNLARIYFIIDNLQIESNQNIIKMCLFVGLFGLFQTILQYMERPLLVNSRGYYG